ncbi:MAG: aldolase/citrate lyase family protein [Acidobacteriota bacterium]
MTPTFTAGPEESEPRSDLRVTYVPLRQPLSIEIQSKVQALFGDSLRSQAEAVCKEFSLRSGRLVLEDFGALPFVVVARIEAVVKEAYPELDIEPLPPMREFCTYPSARNRPRRSRLYIPGNQPKFMLNAGIHRPDGIILDLEDSVVPSEKEATRYLVRNALRSVNFFGAERMVRINQGELGVRDLDYVVPNNVHLILIPKVESGDQVRDVDHRIAEISDACGREEPVFLMPIIESARGVLKALEIAEASRNIVALTIGLEDYTADIGTERTSEGRESFFARNMVVNAAKAVGIQAIDTVFSDVSDMEGLTASVREAKSLGFEGKGCIHPRQIKPIHDAFAPTEGEMEEAKQIVLAFDEAQRKGLGVVLLGSKMIDPPVVKRAQSTIDLAVSSGLLPSSWKERHRPEPEAV